MTVYKIQTPDGKVIQIEGPENATDDELIDFARQQIDPQYKSANVRLEDGEPGVVPPEASREKPTDFFQGFGEGATNVLNHAADWAESGLNMLGGAGDAINQFGADAFGMAPSVDAAVQAQQAYNNSRDTQGSEGGKFLGEMAATAPLAALPGGAFAQGALGGALLSDSDSALGVAGDAALGGIAGKAVGSAIGGIANRIAPQVRPSSPLQTLVDIGTEVTPGQTARAQGTRFGRGLAAFEDRASGQPFVGDIITGGRQRSIETLNTGIINDRVLGPIGEKLPDNAKFGRRAVRFAGDKLSAGYDALLPKLSAVGDAQFADDLAAIQDDVSEILPERAKQFNNILRGANRFWKEGNVLDGDSFKAVEERIGHKIRRYSGSQDPDAQDLSEALQSTLNALREMAARQNPEHADALRNLNKGWASLVQVERAALAGKNGVFSPNTFSNAVRATEDSARRRGFARGTALNQDIADAASDILPSEIPDSGTAGRWGQANLLGLATGAAGLVPYGVARLAASGAARPNPVVPATAAQASLAQLLRLGAPSAAVAAPAAVQGIRDGLSY